MPIILHRFVFGFLFVIGLVVVNANSSVAMGPDERDSDLVTWMEWINTGRIDEALVNLEQKAGMLPNDPEILTVYAYGLRKSGDFDKAEILYGQALDVDDDHLGALNYLGHLYVETGRVDEAKQILVRLDDACFFGCKEEDELEAMIETGSSGKY